MRTAAVLTISDSSARGERPDRSGPATAELLRQEGFDVTHQEIVPDDQPTIESALVRLSDQVQLIVTTGGTGIAERDVTPEATRAVCSKLIEGIPERMRAEGTGQYFLRHSEPRCLRCARAHAHPQPAGQPNRSIGVAAGRDRDSAPRARSAGGQNRA